MFVQGDYLCNIVVRQGANYFNGMEISYAMQDGSMYHILYSPGVSSQRLVNPTVSGMPWQL